MNMMAGPEGTFVISWAQTEINGIVGAPVVSLDKDAVWIWRGTPVRIDGVCGYWSDNLNGSASSHRRRAAISARRIVSRALALEGVRTPYTDDTFEFERTFTVSDGHREWVATLIEMPSIARPLLMFAGSMPSVDTPLFIAEGVTEPALPTRVCDASEGVICFTPGTYLETPEGLRPVERLVAGDAIVTKDGGAQTVLWAGSRNVSGARLYAMPDLRPVRIREGALGADSPRGDLIVSPDHRMLISGAAAQDLWGEKEVLVAARDLIDGVGIARDIAAKSVTYHHLMLEAHHVVVANGVETESFHPAAASLDAIEEEQRLRLFDVMPELLDDVSAYGPTSRRALTKAEAALLQSAAA